jgi:hypothetical protein
MNVAYLLEDTPLSSRTRMILAQADALIARGHRVRIVTAGLPVTWRSSRAEWLYVDDVAAYDRSEDDAVLDARFVAENYAIVDDDVFRTRMPRENEPPRVLLCGASQNPANAIDDGYGAAAHARWFHRKLELVRVSPHMPSREEPLDSVQEFHVALTTSEMRRLMHSCDIVVAPAHAEAGFDLVAAEALASGIAVVMSATPSHLSFDPVDDYAQFAPDDNAVELGERLIEVISDEALRARLRTRAREVAEQFRAGAVAARLERALA